MRYIVRSSSGEFGEVRVLAESAADALRILTDMDERGAPAVTVIDHDGTVHDRDALTRLAATETPASDHHARRQA